LRLVKQVLAGAAGVELVPNTPSRESFIVQNIDDADVVSIYNTAGNEHIGIMLYPHTWIQMFKEDDADQQWFCFSETGGAALLNVIEIYKETEKPSYSWWPW